MEIRKIKRNEIPDACRLSHMVYEMAIRRNRPADEQTHKFFYEYIRKYARLQNVRQKYALQLFIFLNNPIKVRPVAI